MITDYSAMEPKLGWIYDTFQKIYKVEDKLVHVGITLQADKDKKVKKKKVKEDAPAEEAPAAAAPAATGGSDRQSSRGSRKAKRTGSNVFSMFSQKQVAEFKEVSLAYHIITLITLITSSIL